MNVDLEKIQGMANWLQKLEFNQEIDISHFGKEHIKTLTYMIDFNWCKGVVYDKKKQILIKKKV